MDRLLRESVLRGDVPSFLKLIQEDEDIIKQTAPGSLKTILHLAARFGHVELASEITKLSPEMVGAEDEKLETPLHEACREGRVEIVRLLVGTDPWVVYKVNQEEESALFVACERGQVDVVKLLLNYPSKMLMLEVDASTTSLHVAASAGHTEGKVDFLSETASGWCVYFFDGFLFLSLLSPVVLTKFHYEKIVDVAKEILKARQEFSWKKDKHGCTPLHLSCSKGHLEITRELLRLDADLSSLQDNEGRTPLHWAAVKGRVNIIDEILSISIESAEMITKHGETVLHLAVKNNQYEAVRYLVENLNITKLVNLPDNDGNTVLHIATAGKLTTMVIYLLKLGLDVNAINRKGFTALDVVESDASNSGALAIVPALLEAGAKRCDQLPPGSPETQNIQESSPRNVPSVRPKETPETPTQHQPRRRRHRHRRDKQLELQNEGLRNARNTITVVAVLIATVTFAAGINPPGGFNQITGKSIVGRQPSFKVFMACNIVALFLSLGIVIFLVSIIPFRRKSMMKLLAVTHKVMWVSTSFMAAAYIAATWTIMPRAQGSIWVLVAVVSIGGGCTMAIFMGLAVLLARHLLRKWEWRKRRAKNGSPSSSISRVEEMRIMKKGSHESTSNSDIDSSDQGGYHLYN
ncbi:Ankyrin repeat family protein, putative [Theobroma cacao]|uniref:Ankyrin repeat family protein, putative n=1 Tax=Theobroma cacao TaxID=3641 RepID=A0A061GJP2_THECC|nr:Ankyrin repeat family protein, putative [Theobroma cacao]